MQCTLCNKYVHKCCSNLTNKEFKKKNVSMYWYCISCNDDINLTFNHIIDEREFLLGLYKMYEDNSVLIEYSLNNFEHLLFDPTELQYDIEEGNLNSFSSLLY